jgi:hypothetical protein
LRQPLAPQHDIEIPKFNGVLARQLHAATAATSLGGVFSIVLVFWYLPSFRFF